MSVGVVEGRKVGPTQWWFGDEVSGRWSGKAGRCQRQRRRKGSPWKLTRDKHTTTPWGGRMMQRWISSVSDEMSSGCVAESRCCLACRLLCYGNHGETLRVVLAVSDVLREAGAARWSQPRRDKTRHENGIEGARY